MFYPAESVNVSYICKTERRVTHLGLETLENRCHHLPDFLHTHTQKEIYKLSLSIFYFAKKLHLFRNQTGPIEAQTAP